MSTTSLAALPLRPIDPVIENRLTDAQRAAFRAAAGLEMVLRHLHAHNDEEIGGLSVALLADALDLAYHELDGVTNQLDTVRFRAAADDPVGGASSGLTLGITN
jgi:hypothetical protein